MSSHMDSIEEVEEFVEKVSDLEYRQQEIRNSMHIVKIYPKTNSEEGIKKARYVSMKEFLLHSLTANLILTSSFRSCSLIIPSGYVQFVIECFMFHNKSLTPLITKELLSEAWRKIKDNTRKAQKKASQKKASHKAKKNQR